VAEPARAADLPRLLRLLESNELPTIGFSDCVANCLVVRDGVRPVGAVALELYGRSALLRSLVVDEPYRGRGLGQLLTGAILQRAREHGVRTLYLLTETAEPFFTRIGFVPLRREAVAAAVRDSVEFTAACPATAVAMRLELD
jgi:N-acetylglutamate synthase-like GNAT family acetyltransferase